MSSPQIAYVSARYSSALEYYVEALEVLEMLGDRDSTEDSLSAALEAIIATVCCNVGSLLASQQRSTEAEEMVSSCCGLADVEHLDAPHSAYARA